MEPIRMVDLVNQYTQIKEEVKAEIDKVLDSAMFINGPAVHDFQGALQEYLSVKHVIPCANGTDALQVIMMAHNFPKGSEVLVPSYTYVATVEVIALLGLKPVFVEVCPKSFNIDIADLDNKITSESVAIVPVHLYGQCARMEELMKIAEEHSLKVFEDTAQAIGASYTFSNGSTQKAGTIGHAGATSFFPSKNLGAYGDGGAIMTNDDELASKIRMIVNHGQSKRYYHDSIGVNSRLDSLQAAILKVKLKYLDGYNKSRYEVASFYSSHFQEVEWLTTPFESPFSNHVYHQYTLKLADGINRDELIAYLTDLGIPSMIYYPVPNHLQKAYTSYGYKVGDLQVTEDLCSRVFSLPIHSEFKPEQLEFIQHSVKAFKGMH